MGKIILCTNQQAVVPYMFVNTKVEVYSYEELCFYIYNNVALLYPEQFQGRFIQWLRAELEMEELANTLESKRPSMMCWQRFYPPVIIMSRQRSGSLWISRSWWTCCRLRKS